MIATVNMTIGMAKEKLLELDQAVTWLQWVTGKLSSETYQDEPIDTPAILKTSLEEQLHQFVADRNSLKDLIEEAEKALIINYQGR